MLSESWNTVLRRAGRRGREGSCPPYPRTDPGVRYYRTGLFRPLRVASALPSAIASSEVGTDNRPFMSGQSLRFAQGMVSYVGYVCLSVPSPCERRYRLRVLWTDPTPCNHRLSYLIFRFGLPDCFSGVVRVSQACPERSRRISDASLHAYRALHGPRQTLWNLAPCSDSIVLASRPLTRSPSAPETCVPYTL